MIDVSQPTFPPLLNGHPVGESENPVSVAGKNVESGKFGAGDLLWSESQSDLKMALVLEPDVKRIRCTEILYVLMVAFGDAAGSIIPPEISITYQWPNRILLNNGEIGFSELIVSDDCIDGIPNWMIVGLEVRIVSEDLNADTGINPDMTTMWEEGCVDITKTKLLESVSRHALNGIHTWSEDGFQSFHEKFISRLCKKRKLVQGLDGEGSFLGLDENGNALFGGSGNKSLSTIEAMKVIRK